MNDSKQKSTGSLKPLNHSKKKQTLEAYYNFTVAQSKISSMKIHVLKDRMGALRAADEQAEEALKKMKAGEYLTADIVRPRNPKFHRLFFALLNVVFTNLPEELEKKIPNIDRLLLHIKLQTDHFDIDSTLGGKELYIPHSISFAEMDEDKFEVFFARAITVIRKHFLPGISERELRDSIDAELSRYG